METDDWDEKGNVSNFPALQGTTMEDYTDSLQVLLFDLTILLRHPNMTGPGTNVASIRRPSWKSFVNSPMDLFFLKWHKF